MNQDILISHSGLSENYLQDLLTHGHAISIEENLSGTELPLWYDECKFKRAQRYFQQNFAAIYYATICGLLTALSVPSILNALIFSTKRPSFRVSAKRYLAAMKHTINWYRDELHPGSSSWESLSHVRKVHTTIMKHANSKQYGVIISQKDMAITQFAFVGFVILTPKMVGAHENSEDLDALCHFWRVLGFLLGMEDRFNLCTDTYEDTVSRMQQVLQKYLAPSLETRNRGFEEVTQILLGGLWCFNLLLDYDALVFAAGRVAGLPGYHYWTSDKILEPGEPSWRRLGRKSRMVLFVILSIHEILLKISMVRRCINWTLMTTGNCVIQFNKFLSIV